MSAYLEIWDIAGLVKGASKGEGLGNAFLSNIASVDGIFHVCRSVGGAAGASALGDGPGARCPPQHER